MSVHDDEGSGRASTGRCGFGAAQANARTSGARTKKSARNHPSWLPSTAGNAQFEQVHCMQVRRAHRRQQGRQQARAIHKARAFGVARRVKVSQQLHGLLTAQAAAPVARLRLVRLPAARPAGAGPLPSQPLIFPGFLGATAPFF